MNKAPDFRSEAKRLIDELPEGAGWDELAYEVSVRQAIEQGLADVTAGRTIEHDVLMALIREATRRLEELRDGTAQGVRAEEVFEEVRKSLGLRGPTNSSLHTAERCSARQLKVIYDRDTDSLYIDLVDRPSADSLVAADGIVLDFDAEGRLVGIDIEQASQKIELERL